MALMRLWEWVSTPRRNSHRAAGNRFRAIWRGIGPGKGKGKVGPGKGQESAYLARRTRIADCEQRTYLKNKFGRCLVMLIFAYH